ncbi:MAG: GNAT family N-acetyltransferase, partial [Chloroflexi bacterium]
ELLAVDPDMVRPLVHAAARAEKVFVMAHYERSPLGTARLDVRGHTAEIEAVVTAPLWHGMGLEPALIASAVQKVLARGVDIVFCVTPVEDYARMYRHLGFVELTRVLTYWLAEDQARRFVHAQGETNHD